MTNPIRDAVQIAYPADLYLTSRDGQAELPLGAIASEAELADAIHEVEAAGGETVGWHVSGTDASGRKVSLHEIES